MQRRDVLEAAGAVGLLGSSLVSGCLQHPQAGATNDRENGDEPNGVQNGQNGDEGDTGDGGDGPEWSHGIGGMVDAVAHGVVFGREDFMADGAEGGVFALDVETGEHWWTYGETGGYTMYTSPTVVDAVYFGRGDDAIGSGAGELNALEFDGTVRWTRDVGSVYSRPRVVDGAVFVASDDGVVRAFETADGELSWRTEDLRSASPDLTIAAVGDDVVYVATGGLVGLDRADGSERWTYGTGDDRIRGATVVDGVAYVSTRDGVSAIDGGEERWSVDFESNAFVQTVEGDRVFVRHEWDLFARDAANGEERWTLEDVEGMGVAVHGDVVYVGGDRLRAIDAVDGSERWSTSVGDGGPVKSIVVDAATDGNAAADEHVVYVHTGDSRLHRFEPDGEETWTETVEGKIRNFLVDRSVFVGTTEGIYALDPG